jgi:hypothetical protein
MASPIDFFDKLGTGIDRGLLTIKRTTGHKKAQKTQKIRICLLQFFSFLWMIFLFFPCFFLYLVLLSGTDSGIIAEFAPVSCFQGGKFRPAEAGAKARL